MERAGPGLLEAVTRFRRMFVLIVLLVFVVSTSVGLLLKGQEATAQASVALTPPSGINVLAPGVQSDAALTRYARQRALFVSSDVVLADAASRVDGETVARLRAAVSAVPSATSTSMIIGARDASATGAVGVVEAVVAAYREQTAKQIQVRTASALASIEGNAAKLRQTLGSNPSQAIGQSAATTLSELNRQSNLLQSDSAVFGDGVDFVAQATLATTSRTGAPVKEMGVGAMLGLILAATAVWVRADRDPRLRSAHDVKALLEAPLLGELPLRLHRASPTADIAEVTRRCRDFIAPLLHKDAHLVVLVTSAERANASTTVAAGIAAAAAAEGRRVLLVDGDPTGQAVAGLLGLAQRAPGLLDAAHEHGSDPSRFIESVALGGHVKLQALGAGVPQADEWTMTTLGLQRILDRLRTDFELVVLDAPLTVDAFLPPSVASMVDAVVVVVEALTMPNRLAELSRHLLINKAPVLGFVFAPHAGRGRRDSSHDPS